jgi:hypothetical protein
MSLPLSASRITAIGLIAAIAIVLFTANVRITNAQQQLVSQPAATQNATLFQSTEDSFRVQVPKGWVIHQFNDTGSTLLAEVLQGYGLLAQLCPEQQQAFRNVGSGAAATFGSCQGAEDNIIHIIRYPNLGATLGLTSRSIIANNGNNTINNILPYQIQKLEEVGYRDIKIVNSTDTRINVANTGGINNNNSNATSSSTTTIPAKLVEMTYSTNFAPNEVRRGYFISTATDATPHDLGIITGYGIFYEAGASSSGTTTTSGSLSPLTLLPAPVRQIFGSFELIAAEEVLAAQPMAQAQPQQTEQTESGTNHNNQERTNNDNNHNDHHNSGGGTTCEDGVVHGKAATNACNDYGADCDGCDGSNHNSGSQQQHHNSGSQQHKSFADCDGCP